MSETTEHNKTLVRRFYDEVENRQKLDVVAELFTPDFRDVYNTAAPFTVAGHDGVRKLAIGLHESMDLHITIEELTAEDDRVVARIACHGKHKVPLFGVSPTGKPTLTKGVEMFRVRDGKLAERWVFIDMYAMMRDLGVAPQR